MGLDCGDSGCGMTKRWVGGWRHGGAICVGSHLRNGGE